MLFLVDDQHQNGFDFRVAIEKSSSEGLAETRKKDAMEKNRRLGRSSAISSCTPIR